MHCQAPHEADWEGSSMRTINGRPLSARTLCGKRETYIGAAEASQAAARVMFNLLNSERRYGAIAIVLHWLMALVLIALVAVGLYMVSLPDTGFDARKIRLILFHKELGVVAFVLAAPRLLWRLGNALPRLVETLPYWQKVLARFVHLCFYGLMFALPVTGWIMSSAAGIPVSVLGLFTLPDLVARNDLLFRSYIQ